MRKTVIAFLVLCLSAINIHCHAQQRQIIHTDIRNSNPSPVYDFIERYFAELEQENDPALIRLKLKDDKVEVVEGSLSAIRAITVSTPFTLNRMSDAFYQMSWADGGKTLLTLRFPVSYELLLGMPKVQIEQEMRKFIYDAMPTSIVMENNDQEYELADDSVYKTRPALFYQLATFNDARYYYKEGKGYVPVFDNSRKWYSAANLFQGVVDAAQHRMYIVQNLYGGKKLKYTVSVSDWLSYCAANNLQVFFCVEEEHADGLKVLLVAHSNDMNYNHMMQIIIPDNFINNQECVIKATLNAFIPTQNIKELYQKYTTKKR